MKFTVQKLLNDQNNETDMFKRFINFKEEM